jgi:hypothetical protein
MGKNGLNAILNLAGLNHYIERVRDNLDKGLTFRPVSDWNGAREMYGQRVGVDWHYAPAGQLSLML